ncbi:hypothetical protein AAD018_015355 [Aestuariibius insulae]|uniref:hypothetical protein n=1 Tax=Aestuariibius insulae TaxID=2058287 RepID=UPI00345E78DF
MRLRSMMAAGCAMIAGEAAALSCMQVTLEDAYEQAAASEETYHVVEGTFAFDSKKAPSFAETGQAPEGAELPARFEGMALNTDGFTTEVETEVTLAITCAGPWCGGIEPDVPLIAFLRVDDDRLVLDATPCGGSAFGQPDEAMRQTLLDCVDGGCS